MTLTDFDKALWRHREPITVVNPEGTIVGEAWSQEEAEKMLGGKVRYWHGSVGKRPGDPIGVYARRSSVRLKR